MYPSVYSQFKVLFPADYSLFGHIIDVCTGRDLDCGLQCLRNNKCRSYNCFPAESLDAPMCHLNNETRKSRPEDFKEKQGSTYFELMQVCVSLMITALLHEIMKECWRDIIP